MRPVVVAPMAGGPSSPALVRAAASAGALAFLPGGYKTTEDIRGDVAAVGDVRFGLNLFVPGSPGEVGPYVDRLAAEGFPVGPATWDDDGWDDKVALAVELAPAVVTFTFGVPPVEVVDALRDRGVVVGVTVTTPDEAALVPDVDVLCVQGAEAGAHRGTFANDGWPDDRPLVQLLADVRAVHPSTALWAAGGVGTADDVRRLLDAGAQRVQCGTAFLRCPEAGTRPAWAAALADPRYTETVVTRAFSGRPARGLRNRFIDEHPDAPAAYPEVNNATRPLRAVGDPESMSLWAGTGWRSARAVPCAEVLEALEP